MTRNTKSKVSTTTYYSMWFVLCLFGLTVATLVLNSENRLKEVYGQHHQLLESSVKGTAREISLKIRELRRAVGLFGEREKELLLQLVNEEDNVDAYEKIVERVRQIFPYAFAVTLADSHGEPYIEDFDGFVSTQCVIDLRHFAQTGNPVEPYLHTNPLGYHIDIMTYVDLGLNKPSIFFVSFKPDVIVQLLKNNQLYLHDMMLVHQKKTKLVEIIAEGSREILNEKERFLTDSQKNKIVHSIPVRGAMWTLVYLSDTDMNEYMIQTWTETGIEITLLLIFCIIMFRQFSHSEVQIRKAKIAAEKSNKSKSAFLANMSHEIRTPLTAIIGFAGTLLDREQTPSERSIAASTIIQNGKHLLSVINDILDLSKVEAGKLDVESVPVSVLEIITNIEMMISPQVKEKNLKYNIEYDYPIPTLINSDPTRLKQILMNLFSNAIKFTSSGSITLRLYFNKSANLLCFDVIDTGIGLTKEQSVFIFKEFSQADVSTTRKYGGTGLGLPLTRELVHLLGGTLTLKSECGVGSQFSFSISTGAVASESIISNKNEMPVYCFNTDKVEDMPLLTGRILLAEDTPAIQDLFKIYIKKIGPELTVVDNGKLAIDLARNETFDLILMDMQMPVMGGVEAVEILRKEGNRTPIFALTANAMVEDRNRCFAAGFDDFLTKPIQQFELYSKISNIFPRSLITTRSNTMEKNKSRLNLNLDSSKDAIRSMIIDDEPELIDLVIRFIHDLPEIILALNKALNDENWSKFNEILHQLVATSGGIGYPCIMELCREIELLVREENYMAIEDKLHKLQDTFNQIYIGGKELQHCV